MMLECICDPLGMCLFTECPACARISNADPCLAEEELDDEEGFDD